MQYIGYIASSYMTVIQDNQRNQAVSLYAFATKDEAEVANFLNEIR